MASTQPVGAPNFIRTIINEDLASGKHQQVVTRFPPEPNGFLHIGHAKSICLNFGVAAELGGACYLRLDDTNPLKEDVEYVEAIKADVHWLGFDWGDRLTHASDYFDRLYDCAVALIKKGKAYVDSLSADEIRAYRGTLTEAGKDSPYRNRSVEENLDLFTRMRNGEFADGTHVLRARIDMASPNINMRDPTIYRIRRVAHQNTGDKWCIYPMYDFAHCFSDAFEGITHSLCTLEFEAHRPLYDWFLDEVDVGCHPRQIEFARFNIDYTVMSKRKLRHLVEGEFVEGWDDPRMPTIAGIRRRGYTPEAIREFFRRVGIAKAEGTVDMALLEHCIRDDLEAKAPRAMCVLNPIKVVIENYPEGKTERFEAPCHPQDAAMGTRELPFSRELYIDREDFMENPPKDFFRLGPGREVRLRNAYVIKCESAITNAAGEVVELRCTYDPDTLGKNPVGRKVKGIVHWVDARESVPVDVCLYDRLFSTPNPGAAKDQDFTDLINPDSLVKLPGCLAEASLGEAKPGDRFQFERVGYFHVDPVQTTAGRLVFNRIVTLKDTWAKAQGSGA